MIPNTIDEVTPAWLAAVMDAPVAGFELTQIGQGVGIMGDIYRARLSYSEARAGDPESVVVKLPSSFPENRAQGVALGMFAAEVRFYNELGRQVPTGLPRIYKADIADDGERFVIVMEDLSAMTMVDQYVGLTVPEAMAAVRVLARIHAVWWGRAESGPEAEEVAWIPTMVGPRIEFVDTMLVDLVAPFADKFAAFLPEGGLAVYEAFAGNYLNITKTIAARSPWTLVHQDFRVENMMFADDRVVVIDWQGIGRGPAAYDLAYLLGGSMDTTLRRDNEAELLDAYYTSLVDAGVSGYGRDALVADYGLAHFMGGLATSMVVGGGMDLSNERGMQLAVAMSTRHVNAALDFGGAARIHEVAAAR